MGHIIGVLSGKGGVGKTTTVVNLGVALQKLKKKVVIVEGNLTGSNLGLHLGLIDYPKTMNQVLNGKLEITQAVLVHESNIHYIPGSLSITDAKSVNLKNFHKQLIRLAKLYDYVLVDGSPGIDERTIKIMRSCEEIIIVTNPEITAVADAVRVIEVAHKEGVPIRGIVLNKIRYKRYELSLNEIESTSNTAVIGIIPDDQSVPQSIASGLPVTMFRPNSGAARAYMGLAQFITGGSREEKHENFFQKLKEWLIG